MTIYTHTSILERREWINTLARAPRSNNWFSTLLELLLAGCWSPHEKVSDSRWAVGLFNNKSTRFTVISPNWFAYREINNKTSPVSRGNEKQKEIKQFHFWCTGNLNLAPGSYKCLNVYSLPFNPSRTSHPGQKEGKKNKKSPGVCIQGTLDPIYCLLPDILSSLLLSIFYHHPPFSPGAAKLAEFDIYK
jgi:hypothetical protein